MPIKRKSLPPANNAAFGLARADPTLLSSSKISLQLTRRKLHRAPSNVPISLHLLTRV